MELFKVNQIWYGVSYVYLECKAKRFFAIACLGKKVSFSYGSLRFIQKVSFSYGNLRFIQLINFDI